MRFLIALVLVLLAAPVAMAAEPADPKPTDAERVEPTLTQPVADEAQLILTPVVVEERGEAEKAVVQDMPRRGSFWWVVGAIVVAGVILAVLL